MKTKLCTLFLSLASFFSFSQAPSCGDDIIRDFQKRHHRNFDRDIRLQDERIRYYMQQQPSGATGRPSTSTSYTIPVVFHVVHNGEAYGSGSNISYQQILSQLNAMNAAFSKNYPAYNNQTHPAYAQNTGIQFCLASIAMPSSVSFYNGPGGVEKGVMRYANTSLSHHQMGNTDATAMVALTHPTGNHFPFDKYLNVWVVSSIGGSSSGIVMGYAPRPLMGAYPLDGVVMRSDVVGDNSTGNTFALGYGLAQGKVMVHELGHYFNLMHIFEGGCAGANAAGSASDPCDLNGDMICDIEPCTTQNIACNAPVPNTCSASYPTGTTSNDMIEDYMSYADDDCMNTFTQDQTSRMHATLNVLRQGLWQTSNLAATGVIGAGGCSNSTLYLDIVKPSINYCINTPLVFSNPTVGNTANSWQWTLTGGTPASATTSSVSVTYTAPGLYYAKLKVSDGTLSRTDSVPVAVTSCTLDPKKLNRSNWLFGDSCSIAFTTGNPVVNDLVLRKKTQRAFEVAVSMSDSLGNLLFYSDGVNLWDNNHVQVNTTPLFGWNVSTGSWDYNGSSVYGFTAFEVPKQPGKYALICIPPQETNGGAMNAYCKISSVIYDVNTHTVSAFQSLTHPSIYTPGSNRFSEDLCVVPHCNGVDYWVLARGWTSNFMNGNIYAFLFNQNGLNPTAAPVISGPFQSPTGVGGIKSNPAGNKIICGSGIGRFLLYDFHAATGVLSNQVMPPVSAATNSICLTCAFSPNGQYLYLKYGTSGAGSFIEQVDVNTLSVVKTLSNPNPNTEPHSFGYMEIGPDNNIYYNAINSYYLGKIANPDSPTLSAIAAPVSFVPTYSMCSTNLSLLNFMEADKPAEVPALMVQNNTCSSYSFAVNPCWSVYSASWNFGDGSSIVTGAGVSHTYSVTGVYTVSLTLSYNGQSIPVFTRTVSVNSPTASISGPSAICKGNTYVNNYSTTNIAGATYSWTASNATISGPGTIPSINLVSGNTGVATLSLQVTNGGCIARAVKTIAIDTIPTVSLSASTVACTGSTVNLSGTPAGGAYTGVNVGSGVLTPTTTGIHQAYYTYTNGNGCSNTASVSINVNACTGLQDVGSPAVFTVYPNPSDGMVYLNGNVSIRSVEIFNAIGQLIWQQNGAGAETMAIDLSQASKGFYTLRVHTGGGIYHQRILKE